jgi:hypothetical protein
MVFEVGMANALGLLKVGMAYALGVVVLAIILSGLFVAVIGTVTVLSWAVRDGLEKIRAARGRTRGWFGLAGVLGALAILAAMFLGRSTIAEFLLGHLVALSILALGAWLAVLVWRPFLYFWLLFGLDPQIIVIALLTAAGLFVVLPFSLLDPKLTPLPVDRALWEALVPSLCLFPAVTWLAVVSWPRLDRSPRLVLRAAADVVLSVLLGLDVILVLLAGANLFGLSAATVRGVRELQERLQPLTEIPQLAWVALYAVLALAGIAAVLRPGTWQRPWRWATRARLVPSTTFARRGSTVIHLTLLVSTFVGIAAAPVLEPTVRGQLRARYALALRDKLEGEAALSAYEAIRAAAPTMTAPQRQHLAASLSDVHDVARSAASGGRRTDVEADLAWRLAALQSIVVVTRHAPPARPLSSEAAAAALMRQGDPVRGAADLESRMGDLADRQEEGRRAREALYQVAELAAGAVASAVFLPGTADHELLQILQEYLSGIVENSRLKNLFFQVAERRWFGEPTAQQPPDGSQLLALDVTAVRFLAVIQEGSTRAAARVAGADAIALAQKEEAWVAQAGELTIVEYLNEQRVLEQMPSCRFCGYRGKPGSAEETRAAEAHSAGQAHGEAAPVREPIHPVHGR